MSVVSYEIVPATPADVAIIAARLREPDRAELYAATGIRDTGHLIAQSVALSAGSTPGPRVGTADGQPVCIFGVAPGNLLTGVGTPWMVGSHDLAAHARHFLRACAPVVREMGTDYLTLRNHVDIRNHLAIRWLQWLGFTLDDPVPFGPFGFKFHPFNMQTSPPTDKKPPTDEKED